MIIICAVPLDILGSLKRLFGGGRKAVLHTITSLSFIVMAISPIGSFNAEVVLNCWSFVYFNAVQ